LKKKMTIPILTITLNPIILFLFLLSLTSNDKGYYKAQ